MKSTRSKPAFKLGIVTYNLAKDWDLPTLIEYCRATGYEAAELRTTHKHGVEPDLNLAQRREVRRRFEDSGVLLWGLGTVCEFHSPDPAVVQRHIEECRRFCELAKDVGARGVKVRPNGLPQGVPVEKTLEQIGAALKTCSDAGHDNGVEIWIEVHGAGTQEPVNMHKILQYCGHPNVGITWNSNPTDVKNGSIREAFALLKPYIRSCHINELTNDYPWRELFSGLQSIGYDRYTLQEIQGLGTQDPKDVQRFMRYYRALWNALAG